MRLKNTSRYPDDEVRLLVAFGMKGVRTTGLEVHVKNARTAYRGRAYNGVPLISPAAKRFSVERLVTIGLGSPRAFPDAPHRYGGKRSPEMAFADWREALVAVAAHEARHVWQFQYRKRRSEVDAERFAFKRLTTYRQCIHAKASEAALP